MKGAFFSRFFKNNLFRFKPANTQSIFVALKNFKSLFLIKFQVSILNESHYLLVKLPCKSACENLDVLCMPFAASIAVVIVVIVVAIMIAFLYLHASDVHQHRFDRGRVENLRAYKTWILSDS